MHLMTSDWPWTPNAQKYSIYSKYPRGSNIVWFRSTTICFRDTRLPKSEMHWMTSDWQWAFKRLKCPAHTRCLPSRPTFWSVSFYNQPFSRYIYTKLLQKKNRKYTEWLQSDIEDIMVKGAMYTISTCHRAQILAPFALHPAVFEIQSCRKSETEWP